MPCKSKSIVFKAFAPTGRFVCALVYPGCYPGLGASALFRAYCCNITFRCNMWMLLIVKLLSFKRYNYPFYKCRESGRQMQCAYSQPVSDEVVPFLLAFFVRFWKEMQCIVSQPLPFLVLQNAYLVAKIQIYIGLEQTIILKNIISQLLFG